MILAKEKQREIGNIQIHQVRGCLGLLIFFSLSAYHGLKTQISYFKCLDRSAYDWLKMQISSFKEVKVELRFENANKRFSKSR